MSFFSLGWEGDPPARDRFSPYKGNQNFRIQNFDREGIRENFKNLEKNNFEALVISIEKNTQVALWMTEQFLYIPYYRKLTLHEIKVLEINAT